METKIGPEETKIIGQWETIDGKVVDDSYGKRISSLIKDYLIKIVTHENGWETLYQDPDDKRFWELTYLHSNWHGGGPQSLINISIEVVRPGTIAMITGF